MTLPKWINRLVGTLRVVALFFVAFGLLGGNHGRLAPASGFLGGAVICGSVLVPALLTKELALGPDGRVITSKANPVGYLFAITTCAIVSVIMIFFAVLGITGQLQ